ncbi:MAG: exodeoxyribonuclease III [Patescibacteria group bacterium]
MKIITWNVNGLRSVHKKGFLEWFHKEKADIVCLQEIKARGTVIPVELKKIDGYHLYFNCADKPGYAGVAVYAKKKPKHISKPSFSGRFDQEGRILELQFENFTLIDLYLPHGGRQKENLAYKLDCYECLFKYLINNKARNYILAGDFNIAHTGIDLARPKQNQNNIMFTSEERTKIDQLIKIGFIDAFRYLYPAEGGHYTWWPYMANARQRNLGWRIDYVFIQKLLANKLVDASMLNNVFGSDHCPVELSLKI